MDVTGIVLAAHAPATGLAATVSTLQEAGCREVIVVLGGRADAVAASVPRGALAVVATDWDTGAAAVLKVGLGAAATSSADAALVIPADLPQLTAAAARAVLAAGTTDPRGTLARAHFGDQADYPVFIGRDHWSEVADPTVGDTDVHEFLDTRLTVAVDCTDLSGPTNL